MENQEMTVQASTKVRKITLDPLRTKALTNVEVREVESTAPCGMRLEWFTATDDDGQEMDVHPCIHPWLTFEYKGRGFCIDMRDMVTEVMAFADETEGEPNEKI